jgi:hypothetical protein
LGQWTALLDSGQHVPSVAVLQHEIVVVGSLLEIVEFDDVGVVAGLEHLDLVFEQLVEFAFVRGGVPLIMSRRIVLIATTSRLYWWMPL